MLAGAVPIYLGPRGIVGGLFNPEAVVDCGAFGATLAPHGAGAGAAPAGEDSAGVVAGVGPAQAAALARCAKRVLALDADPRAYAAMRAAPRLVSAEALEVHFASHPDVPGHDCLTARLRLLLT